MPFRRAARGDPRPRPRSAPGRHRVELRRWPSTCATPRRKTADVPNGGNPGRDDAAFVRARRFGEQRHGVFLRSAMREELDEEILADTWGCPLPQPDAVTGRPAVAGEFTHLQERHQGSPPFTKVERQRPWNHEQMPGHRSVGRYRDPRVMRPWPRRIVLRPVDGVHDARLRGRRRSWQREIGVAAQPVQQCDLVIEPAVRPPGSELSSAQLP